MKKNTANILIFLLSLGTLVSPATAGYYKDDLFPIGLTGLNATGDPREFVHNCPYSNVDSIQWTWSKERSLINELGINVIGSSDALPIYLVDLKPCAVDSADSVRMTYNYLHQVCTELDNLSKKHIILT